MSHRAVSAFVFFLLPVVGAAWWGLARIESINRSKAESSLKALLASNVAALNLWREGLTADVLVLAEREDVRTLAAEQLEWEHDPAKLRESAQLKQLRHTLEPFVREYHLKGFALLSRKGTRIAASSEFGIGEPDRHLAPTNAWRQAMNGNPAITAPGFDAPGDDPHKYSILTAAPVRDSTGDVNAVLFLHYDAVREFTTLLRAARLNKTGESYVFNHEGVILSNSRFKGGFGTSEAGAALLPRPQMAAMPLNCFKNTPPCAGSNLDGYPDYRGTMVVGAWDYVPSLDLAVAVEMDMSEAYASFYVTRRLVLFMLSVTVVSAAASAVVLNRLQRQRQFAQMREQLLSTIAHDLKNPIGAMKLNLSALERFLPADFAEQHLKLLKGARLATERMHTLVQDLLSSAQIAAGSLVLNRKPCPAAQIMTDTHTLLEPLAREKNVRLECIAPANAPDLFADRDRLMRVFSNVVGNALKFTPEGGLVRLTGEFQPQSQSVLFTITDTGRGIKAADLPHVFDRYWQSRETAHLGSGLGLFIAKGVITAHGGKISIRSTEGQGTTVVFDVPAVAEPRAYAG